MCDQNLQFYIMHQQQISMLNSNTDSIQELCDFIQVKLKYFYLERKDKEWNDMQFAIHSSIFWYQYNLLL